MTGNPIDLDAVEAEVAQAIGEVQACVAPLIAELRQHRQLADHLYDDAQAIVNKDPASLGRRGALLDAASRMRAIQRGPVPPEEPDND